jgi:hypothetical protein
MSAIAEMKAYVPFTSITHEEVVNEEHYQLTKFSALDVSHPLISWLKADASSNIPFYVMIEATK